MRRPLVSRDRARCLHFADIFQLRVYGEEGGEAIAKWILSKAFVTNLFSFCCREVMKAPEGLSLLCSFSGLCVVEGYKYSTVLGF